jgi:SAM-dependent methyltransferase
MSPPGASPCPICGGTEFREFSGRPGAVCAKCGALERHRALVRVCADILTAGEGRACLEIGPTSREVYGDYLRGRGWEYVAVDKWRTGNPNDPRAVGFIDHEVDVAELEPFEDATFDVVIAQHVIEEVPDYLGSLRAIRRVLKPGGQALLEIPYGKERDANESHNADGFGNVWRFGKALLGDLAITFGGLELAPLESGVYRGELMICTPTARG